jgi:hypothetical protein
LNAGKGTGKGVPADYHYPEYQQGSHTDEKGGLNLPQARQLVLRVGFVQPYDVIGLMNQLGQQGLNRLKRRVEVGAAGCRGLDHAQIRTEHRPVIAQIVQFCSDVTRSSRRHVNYLIGQVLGLPASDQPVERLAEPKSTHTFATGLWPVLSPYNSAQGPATCAV